MRKLDVVAILFFVLSLARPEKVEAAPSDLASFVGADIFHGKTPGKNAKNWIMLITLTPRNSPPPILLISPTKIDVEAPQKLIRLSRAQYASFARYTRATRCQQTSGGFLPSQALEATERANGKTRGLCRMSLPTACRYLTGIRTVHAIGWMEQKWEPVRNMSVDIGCKRITGPD
jgi:hypothetical protein